MAWTWCAIELWGRRRRYGAVSDLFLEHLGIYACEAVGEIGWWGGGGEVGWWEDVWEVSEAFRWRLVVACAVCGHSQARDAWQDGLLDGHFLVF